MTTFLDGRVTLLIGDARAVLKTLPDKHFHCVVTSPPYFGLRDYGTATWEGGDVECDHAKDRSQGVATSTLVGSTTTQNHQQEASYRNACGKCGAVRSDDQIGLEDSPEAYVAELVGVFREVRRVLRDDGVLWLNLGDSYARAPAKGGSGPGGKNEDRWAYGEAQKSRIVNPNSKQATNRSADIDMVPRRFRPGSGRADGIVDPRGQRNRDGVGPVLGLKEKDLMGIPWRVAFALQADGWVLRQEIIWAKPNPMPESVTDRCTKSHEQLFLFAKAKWSGPNNGRFAHISDQDARWLACCIDTEGCIVVKRTKQLDDGADSFAPQVSFGSTSRALIDTFVAIVGHGSAAERPGKNAPMFYWQAGNNIARDFLYRIYPYLIVKQRQARIGIHLDTLTYYRGGKFLSRKQRTEAENAVLVSLWERSKMLNRFGSPDLSDIPEPIYGRWSDCERYFYDAQAISEPANEAGKRVSLGEKSFSKGQANGAGIAASGNGAADFYDVPETRNRRSVWTVTTQPFAEAHFATFPPLLIEPCVKAGTSESGCCAECGAPRMRQAAKTTEFHGGSGAAGRTAEQVNANGKWAGVQYGKNIKLGPVTSIITTGWSPSCQCSAETIPCTVLDPFGGAGTTALVAATLGRRATLIELNPDYATLARARIESAFMGKDEGSRHMVKTLGKDKLPFEPGSLFAVPDQEGAE